MAAIKAQCITLFGRLDSIGPAAVMAAGRRRRRALDLERIWAIWSSLGGWAIELLVERALFSAGRNLSPSSILMRIMEVVAGGLLMPDGQGIKDPCEREDTSVFSHMTLQMREDVTTQAQLDLRNIHYRKLHHVLDFPSTSSI